MIDDLILRVQYNGSTHDLPVDSDVPLRLDVSAVENGEIGTFFGVGSQTFNLPGTREVNRFFNHGYDISIDDIPAMYNTIPCSVIHNGETVLQGQLQLEEIITKEDGDTVYSVNVSDNTVQFKDNLQNKLLADLDLSAYDHRLSSDFITGSWEQNNGGFFGIYPPLGGVVYYPMADYGTDEIIPFPDQPRVMMSFGEFTNTTGSINNTATPMLLKQFQPAIRLPELLDAVFDQAGFSYVSSFVDTKADNMYVLPKANDTLGPVLTAVDDAEATNTSQEIPVIPVGGVITGSIQYDIEIEDQGGNYSTSSYDYTCPVDANYRFDYSITLPNVGQESNVLIGYDVRLLLNGVLIDNVQASRYGNDIEPIRLAGTFQDNFLTGNVLSVQYRITNFNGTIPTKVGYTSPGGLFRIDSTVENYEGALINMSKQFDPQAKSIDLINGLIQQFNLILIPEPNQDRVIRVETFDDWIRRGERKDWTFRYDTAKKIGINHTVDEQPKQLLFQNEEDADRISKVYTENVPNYQYGTVRVIADSNIPQGEKEIGKFFAPLTIAPMVSSSVLLDADSNPTTTFTNEFSEEPGILPHLYKFENNQQKTYKFKPRIGYKSRKINPVVNKPVTFYMESEGSYIQVNAYSTLTDISVLGGLNATSINFNGNDTTFYPFYWLFERVDTSDAYTDYWKTYIESLYWEGAKKVTLDLYFEPYEYKNIKLNDRIVIKNQVYRINKISGFNISQPDVVKVELLKLYPAYITPGNEVEPWPEPTPPLTFYYSLLRCSDGATGLRTEQTTEEITLNVNDRVLDTSLNEYTVQNVTTHGTSIGIVSTTGATGCTTPPGPGAGRQMFLIYPSNASNPSGTFSWTCQDGSSDSVTLGWDQDWYACIQDGTSVTVPPGGLVQDYGLGCVGCQW